MKSTWDLLLTPGLFAVSGIVLVWSWNRFFEPVAPRVALALWLICAAYGAGALFTPKVDPPGGLAFVAYPWQAMQRPAAKANTGIVFTQIVPWTRAARDAIRSGDAPLWNRNSAAGSPLLANQQTAIYHPFTLVGLLLTIGKSFTLSAALRLFCVSFFTFVFLREQDIGTSGAFWGAIAFTFCVFHVVWLLFPLGLASMMLMPCLAGAHEVVLRPRPAAYVLLVIALSCSVLGGHPESALWVWITAVVYAVFLRRKMGVLSLTASAFAISMLLTAFFWLPTLSALRYTSRYGAMQSRIANPANHGLSYEWLLPLVTPNVLGTAVEGTYRPPRGSHAAVLNDYGEVASGYAGLSTLGLAIAAPFVVRRRRGLVFAFALMAIAFFTIAEVPIWRDALRSIPLAGISLHQRLRLLWCLGTCIAAAFTIDAVAQGESPKRVAFALLASALGAAVIYAIRDPAFVLQSKLALAQAIVPIAAAGILAILFFLGITRPTIAVALVFIDLVIASYKYNPPVQPRDFYPVTGAIRFLQSARPPFRMAAAGWSFLPDTPSYYGIEDIKTTDPVQHARYMRLLKGFLRVPQDSYDLLISDYSQPFFDFLNVRFIYVPPDQSINDARFGLRYQGADGSVFENRTALPRYFLVKECIIQPDFDQTIGLLKTIADFRQTAVVDQVPPQVRRLGLAAAGGSILLSDGEARIRSYAANATEIEVRNRSWALLVSSDVSWPGWRAYVNGRRLPPVIVNGAFVGCFVPPGGGRVSFRYRPDQFDTGLKLAGVGGIVLIAFVIAWARFRRSAEYSSAASRGSRAGG